MLKLKVEGMTGLQRELKRQYPKVYGPAMVRTLNRVATSVKAQSARDIKQEMGGLTISRIKQEIKQTKATRSKLRAVLEAIGSPLSLSNFKARALKRGGVSHTAWGKRRTLKGAFMITTQGGAKQVFTRTGEKRSDIKKLWGPGIARTMANKKIQDSTRAAIKEKFFPWLKREILFRAKR